ncbi:MAG: DNA-3-methyladenine glycosylase [Bacteroidota bacterium]
MSFAKLDKAFYTSSETLWLAKQLLGKVLVTETNGEKTTGKIVETEAYIGPADKASHAYNNRKTDRTKVMFEEGGLSYIYLCYGIHQMFNVVTGRAGIPHAILIRGVEPLEGINVMLGRRKMKEKAYRLTAGPGCLAEAMGLNREHNGLSLTGNVVWIEDRGVVVPEKNILASPRVGIDYAEEYIKKPWRFRIKGSPWTSPAK